VPFRNSFAASRYPALIDPERLRDLLLVHVAPASDRLDNAGGVLVLNSVQLPAPIDQEGPSILHRIISPCPEFVGLGPT